MPPYDKEVPPPGDDDYLRDGNAPRNSETGSSEVLTKPTKPEPGIDWTKPKELDPEMPPVPELVHELIPDSLRPWIIDTVERMSCPVEFMAASALAALGITIGRRVQVRPRRHDDWTVTPNLWGAVIGDASSLKSSPFAAGLQPLEGLENDARAQFERERNKHRAAQTIRKAEQRQIGGEIKKALHEGKDNGTLTSKLQQVIAQDREIHMSRYLVRDATTEKIGILASQNPMGLMVYRDELSGWLATMHKPGREGDRQFYLESWNGNGVFSYDRVTRPPIYIPALCLSICGTIQPEPFLALVRDAARHDGAGDGLVQRFQLLMYPEPPARWTRVDRHPDREAKEAAFDVFTRIVDYDFQADRSDRRPFLQFSDKAQPCFDRWEDDHRNRVPNSSEHPALKAHLSKYPKIVPALALVSHLAEWAADVNAAPPGPIGLEHCERAIRWAAVLEAHARRVYRLALEANLKGAHVIATQLSRGVLSDGFTVRDIVRKGWSGIGQSTERAQDALDHLQERHWIRGLDAQPGRRGGRPTVRYFINPLVER